MLVRRKWSVAAARLALAAAGVLLIVALLTARGPVLERQGAAAVPYSAGEVHKVRVLQSVTVYADGEPRITATVIGSIALLMLASAAFVTAAVLRHARAPRRVAALWAIVAAALGFAGADELLAIHETVGHNLRFLADLPGVSRPDDVVIALYLLPAAAFGYAFRDLLRADRRVAVALAAGLGLFALAALADATSMRFEEHFELLAGLCIAAGVSMLMHRHLAAHVAPGAPVAPARARPRARRGRGARKRPRPLKRPAALH